MAEKYAYTVMHNVLEMDGFKSTFLTSLEGSGFKAEVIQEKAGTSKIVSKHLGPLVTEELKIKVAATAVKPFYEWLKSTLDLKASRKAGALIGADQDLKERRRLTFTEAILTEFGCPAL